MKKYLAAIALVGFLAACGGGTGDKKASDSGAAAPVTTSDPSANPDYQKGLALVNSSACFGCHDIATKKIGPAYIDVATKYAGKDTAVDYLAKKIIAGGSGVWGTLPMQSHPDLNMDSARAMVKYILLLKQ